jgi:hypothetical protein
MNAADQDEGQYATSVACPSTHSLSGRSGRANSATIGDGTIVGLPLMTDVRHYGSVLVIVTQSVSALRSRALHSLACPFGHIGSVSVTKTEGTEALAFI